MKKIKLIIAVILLFSVNTNAQITKGNWMVGGNGSFKSYKSENIKNGVIDNINYINLSPDLGYFIIDKFVIGVKANFEYTGFEGGTNGKSFNVGPFARYYLLNHEKIVNVFTQVNVGYGEYINTVNSKYPTRSYGFKAGTVIFFNSSVALEMALEYNKINENNTIDNSIVLFGVGFQIHQEK